MIIWNLLIYSRIKAANGDVEMIKYLVSKGALLRKDDYRWSAFGGPLHWFGMNWDLK